MEYIRLDEEDFICLVRGGVIRFDDRVSICLKDIGFDKMDEALDMASRGLDIYKDHVKERSTT